jgi:large subunit ribosomal protein L22
MRRFHARGRGRASRIEKWFSHLKIVVAERAQDIVAERGQETANAEQEAV